MQVYAGQESAAVIHASHFCCLCAPIHTEPGVTVTDDYAMR